MGCLPYFAATGTHPLLPIDIAEANYLLPAPNTPLSTTDLIARRAITLQKRQGQLGISFTELASKRRFVLKKIIPILSKTSTSNSVTSSSLATQQLRKLLTARCVLDTSVHSL